MSYKKTLKEEWEVLTRELYPEIEELGNTPPVVVTPTDPENEAHNAMAKELNRIIWESRNEIRRESALRLIEAIPYDNGVFSEVDEG